MLRLFIEASLVAALLSLLYYHYRNQAYPVKEEKSEIGMSSLTVAEGKFTLLKKQLARELLPVIAECALDLQRTGREIHSSTTTERKARWGGSVAGMVGTGLAFFPPTAFVGAALLGLGGVTGIGSMIGGWAHQKHLYKQGMQKVETKLQDHLTRAIDKIGDLLEQFQGLEMSIFSHLEEQIKEVQILYVTLRHTNIMWDSKTDQKSREDWLNFMNMGSKASSASGLWMQSTILTGKAWKAARATAIKDALQAFKAARAAGDVTKTATKAAAIKNAVSGLNAARTASTVTSKVLSGVGAGLGIVALVWDSYELHADNPTEMEQECMARSEQLQQLEDYIAEFCGQDSLSGRFKSHL